MSDVRALLKTKRQEARITHPLAAYTSTGLLRCTVCQSTVKHASAWEGHVISKIHRQNVTRLKDEERARQIQVQQQASTAKRKAEEEEQMEEEEHKKRKVEETSSTFPTNFFSDPSRAPVPSALSDDEEETEEIPSTKVPTAESSAVDLEWEAFQKQVINAPDQREIFDAATVFAEPVLASETPEGFPTLTEQVAEEVPSKLDEEQARKKKEQDERELIMDRLVDEERAQEEADAKVTIMKMRLDQVRRERAAKLAKP